jgi:hypothetical protein
MLLHTPVVFIIFNRADTTERVFAEIAKAKPSKLLVVADGPRADRPGEAEKCAAARAIIERVDWRCEVVRNYSDINLGCGRRPATGISWVFEEVEEAIILEDDCVPNPSFFRFCEELLEKYRDDERVMMIGGRNHLLGQNLIKYSYYFSRIPNCWGWATWRRAWQHYDIELKLWPSIRDTSFLMNSLGDHRAVEHWKSIFDEAYARGGNVDYWDYQWNFTCWAQSGFVILPNVNLISNIGFGEHASHTKSVKDIRANIPSAEMVFPIKHPPYTVWDREADQIRFDQLLRAKRTLVKPVLYHWLRKKFFYSMPV